jgi:hypothetical protein
MASQQDVTHRITFRDGSHSTLHLGNGTPADTERIIELVTEAAAPFPTAAAFYDALGEAVDAHSCPRC